MAGDRLWLRGKSRLMQHGIEKIAGAIAGKGPSSPVGAMCSRSQPEYKHTRIWISERRNRLSPVLQVLVGLFSYPRDISTISAEVGAAVAGHDAVIQGDQQRRIRHSEILRYYALPMRHTLLRRSFE